METTDTTFQNLQNPEVLEKLHGTYVYSFEWGPLILVAFGLLFYLYRRSNPISEAAIDELNRKSFLGEAGDQFRPRNGIVVVVLGIILLIAMNWNWLGQQLS